MGSSTGRSAEGMTFAAVRWRIGFMCGAMYEPRVSGSGVVVARISPLAEPISAADRRGHPLADLEAFGSYASGVSTLGIKPSGLIAPTPRPAGGETVIARFAIASGPGAGATVSECLATFKPNRPGPYHASFLVTVLADELTEFARTRMLSGFARTATSINVVKGTAHNVRVDGHLVLGWALVANGVAGVAVEHGDRVLMWLGEDRAEIPETIYTSAIGGHQH
ncbi:hypothetical protein [Arthrobacter sp. 92]|uniref:hypothetical protein n=1 Tax=Arthrobacter sp. 92 TaxID=3418175 RepID=UPI003D079057